MELILQSPPREHFKALETLLDDPSPQVREALVAEIRRLGEEAVQWLEELAAEPVSPLTLAAEGFLEQFAMPGAVAAFRRYLRGGRLELEKGAVLLQRVVHPRLDALKVAAALDAIAQRTRELIAIPSSPAMTVRALNRVIFHELGYRGEAEADPDPATILLGDVLALRRGIPLSLATLYLLVARRLGLTFEPLVLANRVLLVHLRDREPFLVDPYSRGRFFGWEEAQALMPVASSLDLQRTWPSPHASLLEFACRRLGEVYGRRGDAVRGEIFTALYREFGETSERTRAC
ncbi:MAG: transglutaminase-like domain-containing protein [Opitutales bacterium]